MANKPFSTPIGLLIFKRTAVALKTLGAISQIKPKTLYLFSDGPRPHVEGEAEKVMRTRELVTKAIDWDCRVLTRFHDKNVGQGFANGLIPWVLGMEEELIALEDDCLPSSDFFYFCSENLERYRHDSRIMAICGTNYQPKKIGSYSYYFARTPILHGFALWRRSLERCLETLEKLPDLIKKREQDFAPVSLISNAAARYFEKKIRSQHLDKGIPIHGDRLIHFSAYMNNMLFLIPNFNLAMDIGHGDDAEHIKNHNRLVPTQWEPMDFPLSHPPYVSPEKQADEYLYQNFFKIKNFKTQSQPSEKNSGQTQPGIFKPAFDIDSSSGNQCPLCGSKSIQIQDVINSSKLIKEYFNQLKVNVSRFYTEPKVEIRHCLNCDLRLYWPPFCGDGSFYKDLVQTVSWYNIHEKPEFSYAAKYFQDASAKVLEIGCGKCLFADKMKFRNYTGLEINPEAIRISREKGWNVSEEPLEDHSRKNPHSYDTVCCFQVLEHVVLPGKFLHDAVNCLRENGLFVCSVPCEDSYMGIHGSILNTPPHHVTLWTKACLKNLCNLFPFELVDIEQVSLQENHFNSYIRGMRLAWLRERMGLGHHRFSRIDISNAIARIQKYSPSTDMKSAKYIWDNPEFISVLKEFFSGLPEKARPMDETILAVFRKKAESSPRPIVPYSGVREQTTEVKKPELQVLTFCSSDSGGAGTGSRRRIKALMEQGVDVALLCLKKKSSMKNVLKIQPPISSKLAHNQDLVFQIMMQTVTSKPRSTPGYRARELFSTTESLVDMRQLKQYTDMVDIVHLHWVVGMLDFKHMNEVLKNKPIVWTLADMNAFTGGCHYSEGCDGFVHECRNCPLLGGKSDLAHQTWAIKKRAYEGLDINIICPSRWLAKQAGKSSLFKDRPIRGIFNAHPIDIFRPGDPRQARKSLGLPANGRLILFPSENLVNPRKGYDLLQEALSILQSFDQTGNIAVITFGSGRIQTDFPVFSLGVIPTEHAAAVAYRTADVCVIPSREDNLPNTMCESLACGTPVAGFNIGGLPDLVKHKSTGYLAKPFDAKDLAEGIFWVLENADQDMRNLCRETAERHNTPKIAAEKHINFYHKVLGQKNKS